MGFGDRYKSLHGHLRGKQMSGDVYRLVVEISNACNLKCVMCPRNMMKRKIEFMDRETFESIIVQNYKKLEFVSLNGFGEPLLHPHLFEFLKLCREYGVRTGISTNCTLLNQEKSVALLDDPPDIITLAIDSVNQESFEKVRIGAKFEIVMDNVKQFLRLCARSKRQPFVILQCIYMTETKDQVYAFKHAFSEYKYDAIRIRQLTFSGRERDDANYAHKLCSCYWLWAEPMVLSSGTLVPCCQDVNGQLALGTIRDQSLDELWNQGYIAELRGKHAAGQRAAIPICSRCNMYQPSWPLMVSASFLNTARINSLIPSIETVISNLRYH
jgi:radical SAM protein with 4Fe4S-binding SPASM domain